MTPLGPGSFTRLIIVEKEKLYAKINEIPDDVLIGAFFHEQRIPIVCRQVREDAISRIFAAWQKTRNDQENQVPHYIENVFQKYLGCGILAKGFACAHCEGCCKDFLIAYSCKTRGICPSCNQRAMVQTAAHMMDSVLPRVPFRQFVISFPLRIRHYLETHKLLQAVLKIVVDEIRKTVITCSPNVPKPQIGHGAPVPHRRTSPSGEARHKLIYSILVTPSTITLTFTLSSLMAFSAAKKPCSFMKHALAKMTSQTHKNSSKSVC